MNTSISAIRRMSMLFVAVAVSLTSVSFAAGNSPKNSANARAFFKDDPAGVFDILPQNCRLDMLDYYDNNMIKDVSNAFDETSKLLVATDTLVKVELSPRTTVEVWAPQPMKSDMIVVNYTYMIPAADGNIKIFTPDGTEKSGTWRAPDVNDFIVKLEKNSKLSKSDIIDIADFPVIYYTINPRKKSLTAHLNLKQHMSKQEYGRISPYLRDSVVYTAKTGKFSFAKSK